MQTRIKQALLGAAFFLAATVGVVTPSQAAIYTGNWDPAFGASQFPNLGWQGTVNISVPDACLGQTGTFSNSVAGCAFHGLSVLDAQIRFYDNSAPGTILQTLNLAPTAFINGVTLVSTGSTTSNLIGVNSGFFDPVQGTIPQAQNYWFHLFLEGPNAFLAYTLGQADTPTCIRTHQDATCGTSTIPAQVTYTPAIPEPETYALLASGLVALWLRRRTRAAAAA